jgi:hypothetical protein
MGGAGVVFALAALLVVAVIQAVWLMVKISIQITLWFIRGLINISGASIGMIQAMRKPKVRPKEKDLTPSRQKSRGKR